MCPGQLAGMNQLPHLGEAVIPVLLADARGDVEETMMPIGPPIAKLMPMVWPARSWRRTRGALPAIGDAADHRADHREAEHRPARGRDQPGRDHDRHGHCDHDDDAGENPAERVPEAFAGGIDIVDRIARGVDVQIVCLGKIELPFGLRQVARIGRKEASERRTVIARAG